MRIARTVESTTKTSAEPIEVFRFAHVLNAIAAEHGLAMRATGKAELPRQCLAELHAAYCGSQADALSAGS